MAKHVTVFGANNILIPGRIDDNFGLISTEPSVLTITSSTIDVNTATNFAKCSSGTVNLLSNGKLGQSIVIMSSTGGVVNVNTVAAGTTAYNIIASTSGTIVINSTRDNVVVMKTSTGTNTWTVLSQKTT